MSLSGKSPVSDQRARIKIVSRRAFMGWMIEEWGGKSNAVTIESDCSALVGTLMRAQEHEVLRGCEKLHAKGLLFGNKHCGQDT